MKEIKDKDIENYLFKEVNQAKIVKCTTNNNRQYIPPVEVIKYLNTYDVLDYIFPFHTFIDTKDKISLSDVNFMSNYKYYATLKYDFCHILRKKNFNKLSQQDKQWVLTIEKKYSMLNFLFYTLSGYLILLRPIQSYKFPIVKLLNIYLSAYLFSSANLWSVLILRNEINKVRRTKLKTNFITKNRDVFDDTVLPDWKAYLYFYNIL